MRKIVLLTLSVMLALAVALPIAYGKSAPTEQRPSPPGQQKKNVPDQNLADLTAEWWNWASAIDPSPVEGSYTGGEQCEGEYVEGVFFLAGSAATDPVTRTCTVPADMPIFFPIVNVICSEAFGVAGQDPPDPEPYDTACVEPVTGDTIDPPSKWYAFLDGKKLKKQQQRIASGLFDWTIAYPDNPFPGFVTGTYESASDGLWVYLEEGLTPGEHTIVFGGRYKRTPFGSFEGARVTYHLTATTTGQLTSTAKAPATASATAPATAPATTPAAAAATTPPAAATASAIAPATAPAQSTAPAATQPPPAAQPLP